MEIDYLEITRTVFAEPSRFTDLDDILEMYQAAFLQGITCAIKHYHNPEDEDVIWILSGLNHPLSFNWYCDLFNLDPEILRRIIKRQAGFASSALNKE